MVHPSENPVRRDPLIVQLEWVGVQASEHTLQRALRTRTNDAQLYKCAQVKSISEKTLKERREYGQRYLGLTGLTVEDLWQYVVWTLMNLIILAMQSLKIESYEDKEFVTTLRLLMK